MKRTHETMLASQIQLASTLVVPNDNPDKRNVICLSPAQQPSTLPFELVYFWADELDERFESGVLKHAIKQLKFTLLNDMEKESTNNGFLRLRLPLPDEITIVQIEALKILFSRVEALRNMLVNVGIRDIEPWRFGQSESFACAFRHALNLLSWLEPNEKMKRCLWDTVKELLHTAGHEGDEYVNARRLLVDFAQRFTIPNERYDTELLIALFDGLSNRYNSPEELRAIGRKNQPLYDALVSRVFEKGKESPDWKFCSGRGGAAP